MQKYSNKKSKNKHGCFFKIGWFICLCLVSALLSRYILVGINDMLAIGKSSESVLVEIPEGASLSTIANILNEKGLISEKGFFKLYVKVMKSKNQFSSGSFEMQKNMDYQSILNHLQSNKNVKNVVDALRDKEYALVCLCGVGYRRLVFPIIVLNIEKTLCRRAIH